MEVNNIELEKERRMKKLICLTLAALLTLSGMTCALADFQTTRLITHI